MSSPLRSAVELLLENQNLNEQQMQAAVGTIMDGEAEPALIASFLTALRIKGEQSAEIAGAAQAMRDRVTRITPESSGLLDTCGTGGDELHTFNISTATAIVIAACGGKIAKHGNRSVSSTSGSSNVLETLGVNIQLTPTAVAQCVDEIGIGFCFAPLLHSAMKHVGPVRQQLGFRTIFNLLGPLTNPASAEFQLLGTNNNQTAERLAQALASLGTKKAVIVCGNNELDEISLWGETAAFVIENGAVTRESWTAESFGLPECKVSDLTVSSPEESAQTIRDLLAGVEGPAANMVIANAAAGLYICGLADSLTVGTSHAQHALKSGNAAAKLQELIKLTRKLGEV